ncbi:MAG TPA: ATP-binding cassette domain-containing protein [Nitrospirae bacterium]|nr:ATP-binding cassette domain-containing protein [Nitrospirota bacterium]HDL20360.1 ATP-binding cassette domain-containing protein [Nitrospirota bacterium]HDZ01243.1 ATP-binding cassette domain-containing protein [Nitrospirota bacterium]
MDDLKTLFRLVKPYWQRVVLAGIISLIISGLNASIAWFVKPVLDDVLIKRNIGLIILLPIGIFVIFIFKGVLKFFHEYLMRSASQKMVMNLRNDLYSHILRLPVSYFNKHSSGTLISKVVNDTNALQSVVSLTIKDLFIESATVIALTVVAVWRRWDLAVIALVVLPVAFYGAGKLGKRLKHISKRAQEKISLITENLHESFTGIKIIKAFSREEKEEEHFRHISKSYYRENMRSVRASEFISLIMEVVGGLGIAFVIWYGAKLIIDGVMTIGDFFSFLTAVFLLYTPARRLARVNAGIQQARAPLTRILDELAVEREKGGDREIKSFENEIEYRDVSFRYPSSRSSALDHVSLTIKRGELIAIVGKSGSGKTTLINMLPRFYTPDNGAIYLDGIDIATATLKSLRALFGIVSQDVILFNDTIVSNIGYGRPDAGKEEIVEAARSAYADEFIVDLPDGYDTVVGEKGLRLSGGQKQRISIARAILKNPPVLILDEATSSLDTDSELKIQNALEKLMINRTTIVIAHRLSTVRKADRIIVMDSGKIIETGRHKDLLESKGPYQRLYELQFRGQEVVIK